MDKAKNSSSKEDITIKIKLLDVFPTMNDLKQQSNDIDIIFQGLNIFYNLFELLTNKTEITLKINNKSSIIVSLIKKNELFATSIYNIKQGEQWITFSYENKKKKDTSLAKSLMNCIKLKLICEIEHDSNANNMINSKKLKFNNMTNNSKSNYSTVLTEENNNCKSQSYIEANFHKIKTNKGLKKISLDSSPREKIIERSKFTFIVNNHSINNNSSNRQYIINKKKHFLDGIKDNNEEKGLRKMMTKKSYSKIIDDDLTKRLNKIFKKNDDNKPNLDLTQRVRKNNIDYSLNFSTKNKKNYSIINSKSNSLFNNFGANSVKRDKNAVKSKLLYNSNNRKTEIKNITHEYNNKKNEKEISISNINNTNKSKNCNDNNKFKKLNLKTERSHEDIPKINIIGSKGGVGMFTNRRNKDIIKDLKNNTSATTKTPEIIKSNKYNMKSLHNYHNTIESENFFLNETQNTKHKTKEVKDHSIYRDISSDFDKDENNKICDDASNDSNDDMNNFSRLKEDFILLYSDNYVNNVQEDLLKLEIDLFVEKMTGLISAYHQEMNDRKILNQMIENDLKRNSEKYLTLSKLNYKLNLVKKNYKRKCLILNKNKNNLKDINDKNFETNKNEIELFKLIFTNKKEEKNKSNLLDTKKELKNIIKNLLSKLKNKKIIMKNDIYKKWIDMNQSEIDIKNLIDNETKYIKPKARTRAIPKLQHTKFNSKTNNNEILLVNDNKSEKNIYNTHTHNSNTNIYNKNSAIFSLYPNKFYSRKIPK